MVCVFLVEGMSVIVNVHQLTTVGTNRLGFLNCDDICMCIVNMQFELMEFVFNSVYVDL